MRLLLVSLVSGLLGTAVGVGALLLTESVGAADLLGFAPVMFVLATAMCGLAYAPGLFWLRRRKGCEPAAAFPLVAAFVLNVPVFLFFVFAMSAGKFFSGLGEVLLFTAAFVTAGLVFGRGFVWYCRGRKPAAG